MVWQRRQVLRALWGEIEGNLFSAQRVGARYQVREDVRAQIARVGALQQRALREANRTGTHMRATRKQVRFDGASNRGLNEPVKP